MDAEAERPNRPQASRHVIISGCSGGGKSTLLADLAGRGYDTVAEPGRRIVEAELAIAGRALPWIDLAAFARRAIEVAVYDRRLAHAHRWTFFDRGLVDAAVALEFASGQSIGDTLRDIEPYHRRVFLTPPWPEIFVTDPERRHGFAEAVAEYERLVGAYDRLGYELVDIPQAPVHDRAEFVISRIA